MIRVLYPFDGTTNSVRFEQRCFDNTANPHLGIAALILAGILGYLYPLKQKADDALFAGLSEKKLLPPETIDDPGSLSEEELAKKEARRYPASMTEAIREFNSSKSFKDLFVSSKIHFPLFMISSPAHSLFNGFCFKHNGHP